jgi:hypothetical protein
MSQCNNITILYVFKDISQNGIQYYSIFMFINFRLNLLTSYEYYYVHDMKILRDLW